ncbi:MAG: hypothetical protein Q8M98_08410 [Candidatus Cloacimonadaceae bacterium]|nr:hypothetical protein [Candidatus Cloacimonadaceae bacterium]
MRDKLKPCSAKLQAVSILNSVDFFMEKKVLDEKQALNLLWKWLIVIITITNAYSVCEAKTCSALALRSSLK